VSVLMLAAAYAVAAWLALWLAIPPGYATAIGPAAGLALAGVLIGGAWVAPGIWLGSFVANLGPAWDAIHTAGLLTCIAIPTSIGVGATVQALIGASLVRRCVGFPSPFTRARDIGIFLLLGGPLSCLVSATVGVMTLAVSGQIPWSLFVATWGTWWGGDMLGVLTVTPVALSWLAEPRAAWRPRRFSIGLPLVGTLVLGFVIFGYARTQERARLGTHFERQSETWAQAIHMRLDDYVEVLRACESFYVSAPEVSQQAFHTFVQRSFARHPSLQALSLDLWVPNTDFTDFQFIQQSTPGELVRAERRPEDIAITYIEPRPEHEAALGFDAASVPDRLEALQHARDTGQPTATGRLTLGQDPGSQFGLLISLPLYNPALPHATLEERHRNLHGYITGVFQISAMVESALQGLGPEGIVLWIEDEAAPADRRMLYDSRAREPENPGLGHDAALGNAPLWMRWQMTVEVAGRRWTLHFAPTLTYVAGLQRMKPWAVMGGGLAFSGLLSAFLLLSTGRAMVIEQLIVERTAQLDVSKQLEAEAKQRRREAEVLAELARTINAALEVDTVLQRVVNGAQELCRSDGAAIALCEPGAEAAVIRYWAGRPYRGFLGMRIESGEGIGGLVLATGRSFRTHAYRHDPCLSQAYRSVIQEGGTVAVLVVPIRCGERAEGLLYVGTTRPRTFTDHDESILQRLADHAATALHNARLYAAAEQRRQTAQSLAEVAHLLSQSLDATEVSQRVVDHVKQLLKTRAATLYQLDPGSEMLITLATANDFGLPAMPWCTLPLGMGAAGLAVRTRQLVATADILTDPRLTIPAAVRAGLELTPVRAVLALPLLHDGQVIGALSIGAESGRTFDTEAMALVRLFADYATTALANAQLYTEVQAGQMRLQDLSRKLLEVQEAERRRIAHELHDEAGQLLAAVHLALEATIIGLPPQLREGFHQVRHHLDAIETRLRCLAHELRPNILDDLGLLPALQALAQRVAQRTKLCLRVDIRLTGRLAPAVETALYRIMQEGLTNITKHAAATHVDLQLWQDDKHLYGLLRDDGVGFAVEQVMGETGSRGLGLLGIQERLEALGGTLQITSALGQGTTLEITLPATGPDQATSGALPLGFWQSAGAH
jgi:signal transduction histidine kinase/CHASE1-domain containing sensor protein